MTDFTSVIATDITSDKDRTKRLLDRVGPRRPQGRRGPRRWTDALDVADRLGFPVLLKPLDANDGRGISRPAGQQDEVRDALARRRRRASDA